MFISYNKLCNWFYVRFILGQYHGYIYLQKCINANVHGMFGIFFILKFLMITLFLLVSVHPPIHISLCLLHGERSQKTAGMYLYLIEIEMF